MRIFWKKDLKKIRGPVMKSRWLFVLCLLFLSFLFLKLIEVGGKNIETDKDISSLKEQVEQLEQNKKKLEQLGDFFESDYFTEQEARLRFGMQKEGEQTVIIRERQGQEKKKTMETDTSFSNNVQGEEVSEQKSNESNMRRWWRYFFDNL